MTLPVHGGSCAAGRRGLVPADRCMFGALEEDLLLTSTAREKGPDSGVMTFLYVINVTSHVITEWVWLKFNLRAKSRFMFHKRKMNSMLIKV